MAPRPQPRARRTAPGQSSQTDDETFFIAKRARAAEPNKKEKREERDEVDDDEKNAGAKRRSRKALSFDWVAHGPLGTNSELESIHDTPLPPVKEPTLPKDSKERSVSLSPPPPELEEEEETLRASDDAPGDTSLELNADLAQFYKGRDAHILRERAIEREMARQKEAHRVEILPVPEDPIEVYEVEDSSDAEPAPTSTLGAEPEPDLAFDQTEASALEGTLLLTLRGARQLEVCVRVRPTTQVHTMLDHFVSTHASKLSPSETASIYLSFEGERLDPSMSVEDLDAEDDDMLDVMWSTSS